MAGSHFRGTSAALTNGNICQNVLAVVKKIEVKINKTTKMVIV